AADERDYLRDIQRLTKVTLDQVPLPEGLRDEVAVVATHTEPVRGPRRTPPRRKDGGGGGRRDKRTEAQRDARGEVRVEPRGDRRHPGKPGGNRRRRNRGSAHARRG